MMVCHQNLITEVVPDLSSLAYYVSNTVADMNVEKDKLKGVPIT